MALDDETQSVSQEVIDDNIVSDTITLFRAGIPKEERERASNVLEQIVAVVSLVYGISNGC